MNSFIERSTFLFSLIFLIFLTSCSTLHQQSKENNLLAYTADYYETIIRRHSPVFLIEDHNKKHNLIGTPSARIAKDSKEEIFIAPQTPSIYTEIRSFNTQKDSYTNLIYRIHFEKTPFSLIPFNLGMGKNVGLIVVVTLNNDGDPILYTTVQTCGCYLAFVPTSFTPEEAFPGNWKKERQRVYWESLPGILDLKGASLGPNNTVAVLLKNGSHRVKDMWLLNKESMVRYKTEKSNLKPLNILENLPVNGMGKTSFYESEGHRKGYVKGSFKLWERLLMSWWTFDWRVGEDKKLGKDKRDNPMFYTSLKPWARDDSDMRDFATFLKYWGWNL